MPSASVMIAIAVNPGDLRSWRRANFRSFISFSAQSNNWIDARRAARRNPGRKKSDGAQKRTNREINSRIDSFDFEKYSLERARKGNRGNQANRGSNHQQLPSM